MKQDLSTHDLHRVSYKVSATSNIVIVQEAVTTKHPPHDKKAH